MKRPCPVCKKEAPSEKNPYLPFCSERCKKIDLGKWALGDYRIPGSKAERDSGEEEEKEGSKKKDL